MGTQDGLYSSFESAWYPVAGFYIVFTVRLERLIHCALDWNLKLPVFVVMMIIVQYCMVAGALAGVV